MNDPNDFVCWRPGSGPPPIPIIPRPDPAPERDPDPKEVSDFIKKLYPGLFNQK